MIRVWKYEAGDTIHEVPGFQTIEGLCVGLQNSKPMVWVLVNDEKPTIRVRFKIVPTGGECPSNMYCGTFFNGDYVFHVFMEFVG